jgi:hypothetical protein
MPTQEFVEFDGSENAEGDEGTEWAGPRVAWVKRKAKKGARTAKRKTKHAAKRLTKRRMKKRR